MHQQIFHYIIVQCWTEMERRLGGEIPAPDSPAQKHFDKGMTLQCFYFLFLTLPNNVGNFHVGLFGRDI